MPRGSASKENSEGESDSKDLYQLISFYSYDNHPIDEMCRHDDPGFSWQDGAPAKAFVEPKPTKSNNRKRTNEASTAMLLKRLKAAYDECLTSTSRSSMTPSKPLVSCDDLPSLEVDEDQEWIDDLFQFAADDFLELSHNIDQEELREEELPDGPDHRSDACIASLVSRGSPWFESPSAPTSTTCESSVLRVCIPVSPDPFLGKTVKDRPQSSLKRGNNLAAMKLPSPTKQLRSQPRKLSFSVNNK